MKTSCQYCYRTFNNVIKHQMKTCTHKYNHFIGPLPELLRCDKCGDYIYKNTYYERSYYKKEILIFEYYTLEEHEKICDGNIHRTLYRIKSKYIIPISEL